MELEFKDIEYLCAVEQQRSITKAAQIGRASCRERV